MRLSERFEQRALAALRGMMLGVEMDEMDHEVIPVLFPVRQSAGGVDMQLGMQVALSCRLVGGEDSVMVIDMCQDPFGTDAAIEMFMKNLLDGLRKQRAALTAPLNGSSASGLIIPGA